LTAVKMFYTHRPINWKPKLFVIL